MPARFFFYQPPQIYPLGIKAPGSAGQGFPAERAIHVIVFVRSKHCYIHFHQIKPHREEKDERVRVGAHGARKGWTQSEPWI